MQAGVQAGNFAGRGIVMGVIWNMVQGLCMAMADAVPGVSGGTIAFVMGFYDIFIESLDNIITGNKKEKQNAFLFLLKLGAGWIGLSVQCWLSEKYLTIIFTSCVQCLWDFRFLQFR